MNMPSLTQKQTIEPQNTANNLRRIGILGGTFDPIHYGHIKPALETANWLSFEQLFLLPAHIPPHKKSTSANATHRKAMVEMVCQQYSFFELDGRELQKNTPSYTVESIKEISQSHHNAQLFFMIGMDSLLTLTSWHRWENILKYCHIVVNTRPDYYLQKLNDACLTQLSPYFIDDKTVITSIPSGKIIFHPQAKFAISSTEIRAEIKKNIFDTDKLPNNIVKYIQQHQLYK
ncbi:nicotinate-nucleotide adenylyltransferase [Colwelliaceae bacterium 6441]